MRNILCFLTFCFSVLASAQAEKPVPTTVDGFLDAISADRSAVVEIAKKPLTFEKLFPLRQALKALGDDTENFRLFIGEHLEESAKAVHEAKPGSEFFKTKARGAQLFYSKFLAVKIETEFVSKKNESRRDIDFAAVMEITTLVQNWENAQHELAVLDELLYATAMFTTERKAIEADFSLVPKKKK